MPCQRGRMNLDMTNPIGVFDSGLGGLSVLSEINRQMPGENILYFGDSANAPYGEKPPAIVKQLSVTICDRMMDHGVKAIVVACNTATSAAIVELRRRYHIPVIGMEPALKPAVQQSEGGSVAVLATALTLREAKFQGLLERFRKERSIYTVPCPELVTLVEAGAISGEVAEKAVAACMKSVDVRELSAVVLGCTHYVFLREVFRAYLGGSVRIVDGNHGTVLQLKRRLDEIGDSYIGDRRGNILIENSAGEEWVQRSWEILRQLERMGELRHG